MPHGMDNREFFKELFYAVAVSDGVRGRMVKDAVNERIRESMQDDLQNQADVLADNLSAWFAMDKDAYAHQAAHALHDTAVRASDVVRAVFDVDAGEALSLDRIRETEISMADLIEATFEAAQDDAKAPELLDELVDHVVRADASSALGAIKDADEQEIALDEYEARISDINNSGVREQIDYLIQAGVGVNNLIHIAATGENPEVAPDAFVIDSLARHDQAALTRMLIHDFDAIGSGLVIDAIDSIPPTNDGEVEFAARLRDTENETVHRGVFRARFDEDCNLTDFACLDQVSGYELGFLGPLATKALASGKRPSTSHTPAP